MVGSTIYWCSNRSNPGWEFGRGCVYGVDALSAILALGQKGYEYNAPRPFAEAEQEAEEGEQAFAIIPDKRIMEEYLKESGPEARVNISLEQDIKNAIDDLVKRSLTSDCSTFLNDAAREKVAAIG